MEDEVLDLYKKLFSVIVLPNETLRKKLLFYMLLTIREAELFWIIEFEFMMTMLESVMLMFCKLSIEENSWSTNTWFWLLYYLSNLIYQKWAEFNGLK